MSKAGWIIFIVVVVGLLGGLVVYSRLSNPSIDVSSIDPNKVQAASEANGNIGDHVYDADDGKVTLIEYGDFQCVYCAQAHPQIKSMLEDYGSVVTFVFRNFPITSAHPNAKAAAAAAEAVGLQGNDAYWAMFDTLYQNQPQWGSLSATQRSSEFYNYALGTGIDMDAYNKALEDDVSAINQKIAYDMALASQQEVSSTPTFFLNGKKLSSDIISDIQNGTGDKLREALDAALKDAGITPPSNDE